jgi:hypothetical protein
LLRGPANMTLPMQLAPGLMDWSALLGYGRTW